MELHSAEAAPLTRAREILELEAEEAERKVPFRLRGIVTYADSRLSLWFVRDETAGIYIYPASTEMRFGVGDEIEIEGHTGKGLYSNFAFVRNLKVTGSNQKPIPRNLSITELNSGGWDCEYAKVEGVVRYVSFDQGIIEIGTPFEVIPAHVPRAALEGLTNWVDARVILRGVNTAGFNEHKQFIGFSLRVAAVEDVQIVAPPKSIEEIPLRHLSIVGTPLPAFISEHRLKFSGKVLVVWPGERFVIEQDGRALVIYQGDATAPEAGDVVEVCGFFSYKGDELLLVNPVIKKNKSESLPEPRTLHNLGNVMQAELATVEGKLQAVLPHEKGSGFLLSRGNESVRVFVPQESSLLNEDLIGQNIGLTGLIRSVPNSTTGPEIWLASKTSFELFSQRPEPKELKWLWPFIGGLAIAGIPLAYFATISRRRPAFAEEGEATAHGVSVQEKERLARDLHDSLIQSLYAIGLNLENSKTTLTEKPDQVEPRIQGLITQLNDVIGQVRTIISGLASEPLKPGEFKAAIKSLILTMGEANVSKFFLEVDQPATESLNSTQATQLLHIAREAISNSLRHAAPNHITLAFHKHGDSQVRFEISDDGTGFDTETRKSEGMGLKNIAARVRDLNGTVSIRSQPGRGTTVVVQLPLSNSQSKA